MNPWRLYLPGHWKLRSPLNGVNMESMKKQKWILVSVMALVQQEEQRIDGRDQMGIGYGSKSWKCESFPTRFHYRTEVIIATPQRMGIKSFEIFKKM